MKRLLLVVLLVGCTSTVPVIVDKPEKPLGQEPAAPVINKIHWEVVEGGLRLSTTDGVKMNVERKDQLRYTRQLQNLVCYHEPRYTFCNKEIAKEVK